MKSFTTNITFKTFLSHGLFLLWINSLCSFKLFSPSNPSGQSSHLYGALLSWTYSLCWWKEEYCSKLSPQTVHFNSLYSLWIASVCYFKIDINWNHLPQISHLKCSFHMVYFPCEIIHYAFLNYFSIKSFRAKFTFVWGIAFMNIFIVLMERRILFKAVPTKGAFWQFIFIKKRFYMLFHSRY